jgi:hypothetical protein
MSPKTKKLLISLFHSFVAFASLSLISTIGGVISGEYEITMVGIGYALFEALRQSSKVIFPLATKEVIDSLAKKK